MIDFRFRKAEVLIFIGVILVWGLASILAIFTPDTSFDTRVIILGILATILLCIEHTVQIIFNRDINKFSIVEKALLRNEYKLNKQIPLDDVTEAFVHSFFSYSRRGKHGRGSRTRMYELIIKTKENGNIEPFGYSTSSPNPTTRYANEINEFLAGNESTLTITNTPYFIRILGGVMAIFHFSICGNVIIQSFQYFFLNYSA